MASLVLYVNNLCWQVTAVRRPKNSALEVDLDFEHNVRPAPVITEEVTATLEEMIQKRIIEVSILLLSLCCKCLSLFFFRPCKC